MGPRITWGRALSLGLLVSLAGCCTSAACQPERLPYGGEVVVTEGQDHHRRLFELLQYAARQDCCEVIYGHLSAASRAEHSETTFCLFWEDLELPEPYGYELGDVVRDGEYTASVPGPQEGESFLYVSYPPSGRPGKNLLAQILVVVEPDARGRPVPRLALLEQYHRLERGDGRYDWDAGS